MELVRMELCTGTETYLTLKLKARLGRGRQRAALQRELRDQAKKLLFSDE